MDVKISILKNYNSQKKSEFFNDINQEKVHIKKLIYMVKILDLLQKKGHQILYYLLCKKLPQEQKNDFLISYIIYFCFSLSNSVLHITDGTGNLKISYSAGSIDLKGKKKIVRYLALQRFFNILSELKSLFLEKNPIALHFKNINESNKFLIMETLRKQFFIKIVKDFNLKAHNGCRQKKKRRKRQKTKRK